jgi:hypothetical protein
MNFRFIFLIVILLTGNVETVRSYEQKKSVRPEHLLGLSLTLASFGNDIAALGMMIHQENKEAAIGALDRVEWQMAGVEAQLKRVISEEHAELLDAQMPEIRQDLKKMRRLLEDDNLAEARTAYAELLEKQSTLAGEILEQVQNSFDDRSTVETWLDWVLDWWYAERAQEK